MHARVLQQELLETYPDDHPDAIIGRDELRLVNAVMGNHRWIKRMLRRVYQPGWSVTEIGAGDGALSVQFWQAGICEASELHGLISRDVLLNGLLRRPGPRVTCLPNNYLAVVVANLFLHHFTDEQLRVLGSRISKDTYHPGRRARAAMAAHGDGTLLLLACRVAPDHPIRHASEYSCGLSE